MSCSKKWILGQFSKDLLFIYLPGFIGVAFSFIFRLNSLYFLIYAFLASTVVNAGHVYTTLWRTVFRKQEMGSHRLYWVTPLAIVIVVFFWLYFKIPYLWSFVVYATAYHQIAQFYGFLKWYEKLNHRSYILSGYFLLILMITPFILFHFRQFQNLGFYTNQDIFFHPNKIFFHTGLFIYSLIAVLWLLFEVILIYRKKFELNRFLAILGPAVLYAYCFLVGKNITQILFPLFLSHGVPYMTVIGLSLKRLDQKSFGLVYKTILIILLTAILGGLATRFYGIYLIPISNDYIQKRTPLLVSILTGVYLVPLFCHYIFDGYIWKLKHKDSKLIYSN